jgi:hypothetical protein
VTAEDTFPTRSEAWNAALASASIESIQTGQPIEITACLGDACPKGRFRRGPCALCDRIRVFPDGTTRRVEGRA